MGHLLNLRSKPFFLFLKCTKFIIAHVHIQEGYWIVTAWYILGLVALQAIVVGKKLELDLMISMNTLQEYVRSSSIKTLAFYANLFISGCRYWLKK